MDSVMCKEGNLKLILILFSALLSACSFTATYPENWGAIDQNRACDSIIGKYKNQGEHYFEGKQYQRNISYIVQPKDKQDHSVIRSFEVATHQTGLYELIIGNNTEGFNPINIALECENGSLNISKDTHFTGHEPGAMVLGVESNSFFLFGTVNGNLILKTENSAAGLLLLVIPVAGATESWYKFERI